MVDHLPDPLHVRSFRHSRLRKETLLFLASVQSAYLKQIARAVRTEVRMIRGVMHGDHPKFAPARSLLALRLVSARLDASGRVQYRLTPRGRRVALSLRRRG